MATDIQITSQKFYRQMFNGTAFGSDLTNNTNNLAALVMQKVKVVTEIKLRWFSQMLAPANDPSNMQWSVTQPTTTTIVIERFDGGNFLSDGFSNGDLVRVINRSTTFANQSFINGTITFVDDKNMNISFGSAQSSFQSNIKSWYVSGVTYLTSLICSYGLVENSDSYDNKSLVTNEAQAWYTPADIPAATLGVMNMVGVGIPKSWENGSMSVERKIGIIEDFYAWQVFEITHEFIMPYFNAGEIEDLNNDVPPEWLQGLNSLKYVFEVDFRTVISNPNTSKKTKSDNVLGSVGWFGEAFNGFDSDYELTSVTYTDSALNSADGVLIGTTTLVTATIEKQSGNFNANDVALVYFSYLPELQSEVENTPTNFESNFIYDNIRNVAGSAAQTGTGVLNDLVVAVSTNVMTITFETSFTALEQIRLSNQKSYILGFEVGDITISAGNSDAVILKEVKNFDDSSDIPDLMTFGATLFPYTEDFSTAGNTDFTGWNEHGLAIKGNFILDLTKDAFINSFSAYLIAYRASDNSYFLLDQYDFNLPNTVLNSGGNTYQLLDMATTRNYPLVSGSEKNGVTITLDQSTVGTTSPKYDFTFAQKIRWEDWIKNVGVDTIFTDNSEPQKNLNYKSSNYSALNGYKIKMLYSFNVGGTSYLNVSGNTDYNFFTPDFVIRDYDEDGNVTPNFTQTIETFTADGLTNLGGAVQNGVDTLFKITWTPVNPVNINDFWGIHRIQVTGDTGQQINELGTFETNLPNQILKPITGSFLSMALVGGNIVTTCLIDGSLVQQGVSYDLSGEIGSPPQPDGEVENKITEDSENKITEGTAESSQYKIIN